MDALLNLIKDFLSNERKVRITISTLIVVILLVLIGYGYNIYQNNQEKEISIKVNELVEKKKQVFKLHEEESEQTFTFKKEISQIKNDLNNIYVEYSSTQNGIRALFISAELEILLENYQEAKEKLILLTENHENSYLIAEAFYTLSLVYEYLEDYQQALKTLEVFDRDFVLHYLKPLSLLGQARYQRKIGDYEMANQIYNKIINNESYGAFAEIARESIAIVALENNLSSGKTETKIEIKQDFEE